MVILTHAQNRMDLSFTPHKQLPSRVALALQLCSISNHQWYLPRVLGTGLLSGNLWPLAKVLSISCWIRAWRQTKPNWPRAKSEHESLPLKVVLRVMWGLRVIHRGHEICPMISETFLSLKLLTFIYLDIFSGHEPRPYISNSSIGVRVWHQFSYTAWLGFLWLNSIQFWHPLHGVSGESTCGGSPTRWPLSPLPTPSSGGLIHVQQTDGWIRSVNTSWSIVPSRPLFWRLGIQWGNAPTWALQPGKGYICWFPFPTWTQHSGVSRVSFLSSELGFFSIACLHYSRIKILRFRAGILLEGAGTLANDSGHKCGHANPWEQSKAATEAGFRLLEFH